MPTSGAADGDRDAGAPVGYRDYLHLDLLLGCQDPVVATTPGEAAHDELLFIVTHQAFELWFKQVLWELEAVMGAMGARPVDDRALGRVVHHLERVVAIQGLLVGQLDVLATMTPLDFLDFRDDLVPASGFQSAQFRMIENVLGLRREERLKVLGAPYTSRLATDDVEALERAEAEPSLADHVDAWLARTPFLRFGDFDFWAVYSGAVTAMLARDAALIERNPALDEVTRDQQREAHEQTEALFATLFDAERYEALRERGTRRLSHDAFLAALLIALYRDEPAFQLPFRLLTALVDVDEGLTAWRQRHARLAQRVIGTRIGTGGTSGHAYLRAAAQRHRVFDDLADLATYHIPRAELPALPAEVAAQLGFRHAPEDGPAPGR